MYFKFFFHRFFSFVLTIALLCGTFFSAKAQTTTVSKDVISFQTLGQQDAILAGPLDSREIVFRLPADWSIQPETTIHLSLNSGTANALDSNPNLGVVGFFEVFLNETWLTTVNLTKDNEYSIDIPVPSSAWANVVSNSPQVLKFTLVDALSCDMWLSATTAGANIRSLTAVLRASSYIVFEHTALPISTDLQLFPYPIFQNTFIPDKAVLIIPDQPTQGEMQAAMTVSAAFGRLTDGKLSLPLLTISQLDDTISAESNIIFVGAPAAFPQLANADLPAPYNGSNFDNVQMNIDDGILQMVSSPQNSSKVWMLVSGNTDTAIIKAAQAAGSDQIQAYGPKNLAIISGIGTDGQNTYKTDYTFAELGYPFEQTHTGYYNDLGVWFDMPANQQAADGAYFEMVFTNSAALNFDESNVKVMINDSLIGGLRFSDRTTSITHWKFNIPAYLLHPGRNLLFLEIYLAAYSPCVPLEEVWVSTMPESLLHLPTLALASNTTRNLDLTNYPNSVFSVFDQTALILPDSDSFAWSVASKLAFDLGSKLGGSTMNIATYYASTIPDDILKTNDLILVGRPSTISVMNQFSEVMPAPFENNRDIAQEKNPQYSFLMTDTVPVGYLEVFSSPWDVNRAVLIVAGNMNQGLDAAAATLLNSSVRGKLVGNFIVALDNKIIVQKINVASPSQTDSQVVVENNQTSAENGETNSTNYININLVTIGIIAIVGLLILVVIVWFVSKGARKQP